jgi:hypothetical protein
MAAEVAVLFAENFAAYADGVDPEVGDAGPRVTQDRAPSRRRDAPDAPEG